MCNVSRETRDNVNTDEKNEEKCFHIIKMILIINSICEIGFKMTYYICVLYETYIHNTLLIRYFNTMIDKDPCKM